MSWRVLPLHLLIGLIIAANPLCAEEYGLIPVPEFEKRSFLNGMDVMFLPGEGQRVPFLLMIKNGAAFDPVGKWGVTYLTVLAIREQEMTAEGVEVETQLQKLNVDLDFRVTWDAIHFFGTVPRENLAAGLNLLAAMIVTPQLTEEAFEGLRSRLREQVEEEGGQIQLRTQELFLEGLFGPNAYEHSVRGNVETLGNLYLADLKIQYRELFKPNQAQLALYHDGDRDGAFAALSRHWGRWVGGAPLAFTFRPAIPSQRARIHLVDWSSGADALTRWGVLGTERSSQDFHVMEVFAEYLTLSLPEWADEGQIQASVEVESRQMPGYLQLSIQAPPRQQIVYLRRLRRFLEELGNGEVDLGRLEEAKRLTYQEFMASLEDPVSRLQTLLETGLYPVGVNFVTHYGLRLNRITPDFFRRSLQHYLSWDRSLTILAGPIRGLEQELQELQEFGEVHGP